LLVVVGFDSCVGAMNYQAVIDGYENDAEFRRRTDQRAQAMQEMRQNAESMLGMQGAAPPVPNQHQAYQQPLPPTMHPPQPTRSSPAPAMASAPPQYVGFSAMPAQPSPTQIWWDQLAQEECSLAEKENITALDHFGKQIDIRLPNTKNWFCGLCKSQVEKGQLINHVQSRRHISSRMQYEWTEEQLRLKQEGRLPLHVNFINGELTCELCQKPATEEHMLSAKHMNKVAWQSHPSSSGSHYVQPTGQTIPMGIPPPGDPCWYEWKAEHQKYFCLLCYKFADEQHLVGGMHQMRSLYPETYLQMGRSVIPQGPPVGAAPQFGAAPPVGAAPQANPWAAPPQSQGLPALPDAGPYEGWEAPRVAASPPTSNVARPSVGSDGLPPHWRSAQDPANGEYYYWYTDPVSGEGRPPIWDKPEIQPEIPPPPPPKPAPAQDPWMASIPGQPGLPSQPAVHSAQPAQPPQAMDPAPRNLLPPTYTEQWTHPRHMPAQAAPVAQPQSAQQAISGIAAAHPSQGTGVAQPPVQEMSAPITQDLPSSLPQSAPSPSPSSSATSATLQPQASDVVKPCGYNDFRLAAASPDCPVEKNGYVHGQTRKGRPTGMVPLGTRTDPRAGQPGYKEVGPWEYRRNAGTYFNHQTGEVTMNQPTYPHIVWF